MSIETSLLVEQVKKSKSFKVIVLTSFLLFIAGFISASVYLITLVLTIAIVTAVHESLHIRKARELGYNVKIRVQGLGNIRYELKGSGEDVRAVAREPYFRPEQYVVEALLITLLTLEAMTAGPLTYVLMAINSLVYVHFISVLCTLLTFKGFNCPLAKLASRDDLEEGI